MRVNSIKINLTARENSKITNSCVKFSSITEN